MNWTGRSGLTARTRCTNPSKSRRKQRVASLATPLFMSTRHRRRGGWVISVRIVVELLSKAFPARPVECRGGGTVRCDHRIHERD